MDAASYQWLRVWPVGGHMALVAAGLGRAGLCVGGGIGGAALGLLLPASVGDARILIAIGLGVAGALAGTWLYNFGTRLVVGVIRWAVASRRAGAPAPVGQFLQASGASSWTGLAASAVPAAPVPLPAIWRGGRRGHRTVPGRRPVPRRGTGQRGRRGAGNSRRTPLARLAIRRFLASRRRVRDDFPRNFV
jgi:hypothetical protein